MRCSSFNSDSSENVAYNNPLFPAYIRHGILSSYPDYSAISHWHEDIECILILSGYMTYNVNGELIELTAGNGILVNSRQLHYGFSPSYSECEFLCVLINSSLLHVNDWFYSNFIECFLTNPTYPYIYLDANIAWMNDLLKSLNQLLEYSTPQAFSVESASKKETAYFKIIRNFLFIFETLYKNISMEHRQNEVDTMDLYMLKQMLTYIKDHFSEKITLESISASGTCCKSKCSSLFKEYLRETPISYTTKYRLNRSLTDLINSKKFISEIAYANGFCGSSYYCETFHKYYKISPSKYREEHKKQEK